MVEPICALPPLSESLRDSQGASSVQHRTVIDGMRGPHWGMGLIIYVLRNRWGWLKILFYIALLKKLVRIDHPKQFRHF